MTDTFHRYFLIAVLLGTIAIIGAGIMLDAKGERRNCEARYTASTCNHILR